MIGTIRRHSKALWAIIITVVVVTFVFWGSPSNKTGNQRDINLGSINGEPIELDHYLAAKREVYLLYFFSTGEWPEGPALRQGFDVDRETYVRLLMLQKIKQAKIHVADETVAKVAADLLRLFNRGQTASIEDFVQRYLRQRGLTANDFERYVRNYLCVQQLIA